MDFVTKYRPTGLDGFVGNAEQVERLRAWLRDYRAQVRGTPKAAAIIGGTGVGKSLLASLALRDAGFVPVELNATDVRSGKAVRERLEKLVKESSVEAALGAPVEVGVVVDDLDSIGLTDKGGLTEVVTAINPLRGRRSVKKAEREAAEARWTLPILCVSSDAHDKKVADLCRDCCEVVLEAPSDEEVVAFAGRVASAEGIDVGQDLLRKIVGVAAGDLRRVLWLLQEASYGVDVGACLDDYQRAGNKERDLLENAATLLADPVSADQALQLWKRDKALLPLVLHENYPKAVEARGGPAEGKLAAAAEIAGVLCEADVLDKLVHSTQAWELGELSGVLATYGPNMVLNALPHKRGGGKALSMRFTSNLSKTSLSYANQKLLDVIISRTGRPNFKLADLTTLCTVARELLEQGKGRGIATLLAHYNLVPEDVARIGRSNKLVRGLEDVGTRIRGAVREAA